MGHDQKNRPGDYGSFRERDTETEGERGGESKNPFEIITHTYKLPEELMSRLVGGGL